MDLLSTPPDSTPAVGIIDVTPPIQGPKLPPVWLLGLGYAPVGVGSAVTLMALPQLLAAQRVPEPIIASLTAFALAPGFVAFIFGPLLDWRFRRKSYAIVFTLMGGIGLFAALMSTGNLTAVAFWDFFSMLAISIGSCAVGGWFSDLIPKDDAGKLGAWFTAWNIGSGGITTMFAVNLIRATSFSFGAVALGALGASAALLFALLPCRPADGRLAHESIKAFASDVTRTLRSRSILWSLLLFLSPAASFALTNVISGLGRDFSTSEHTVGLLVGLGAMIAGIFGSLAMPRVERWISLRHLYLLIGLVGALATALILLLPREPSAFAIAVLSENICQSAAFAVVYAITLRVVGQDNPLAATQFSLLSSAMCLPLTYMQVLDGQGYALGHVQGAFLMDAGISGGASIVLMIVFRKFRRFVPAH